MSETDSKDNGPPKLPAGKKEVFPSRDQDKILGYLYDMTGALPKFVATWSVGELMVKQLPTDDPAEPWVYPKKDWCEGWLRSQKFELKEKEKEKVKEEQTQAQAEVIPRAQALMEALKHTDLGGEGETTRFGWDKCAVDVVTKQTEEKRQFAQAFKDFEKKRMATCDAIADRPDGKSAMAAFKSPPFDLGRAPAWLQDKAREWWTQTFSEARIFYVQAYVTHKTGEWVDERGVRESVLKGEDRMGAEARWNRMDRERESHTQGSAHSFRAPPPSKRDREDDDNSRRQRSPPPRQGSTRMKSER